MHLPLSLEHAALIANHLQFTDLESDYFLLSVQISRAGNEELKSRFKAQLKKLTAEAQDLSKSLPSDSALGLEEQVEFYSDWRYSAIRVLSSISEFQSLEAIASKLGMSRKEVKLKSDFLVRLGLCRIEKEKLLPGPAYTHLPAKSLLISKVHNNIRVKAMEHHARISERDICYSSLLSVGRNDQAEVRAILKSAIEQINRLRESSKPETLQLLGIDWIQI